jgi:NAD(P)-dependent dehydrogenase (short-subunit alcohol dehydrogenase family)
MMDDRDRLRELGVRPQDRHSSTRKGEMDILKGKVAVVTGSTSGIGLAYALAFAGAGANIVLNGMGAPADVEKERAAIESDFGVKAIYSPANMAEPIEIANMISFAERTFGSVDVLVNNAGIQHVSPIEDFPVEKWDAVIAINLSSAFHAIRAVTPGMKQRGWGRILTTASAHSQVASPLQVGLCRGQAWHRGTHQDGGAGTRPVEDHLQLHQPRLRLDAAGGEADPEHDEGAQHG